MMKYTTFKIFFFKGINTLIQQGLNWWSDSKDIYNVMKCYMLFYLKYVLFLWTFYSKNSEINTIIPPM